MSASFSSSAVQGVANAGGSPTVTKPAGVVTGGLYVALCHSAAAAIVTWTPPAGEGWISGDANTASGTASAVFYRLTTGAEAASYTFTRSSTSGNAGVELVYLTPGTFDPVTPVAASKVSSASTGTTIVLTAVTPTTADTLLLQMISMEVITASSWTPPGTATTRASGTASGQGLQYAIGDEVVGAGATGTRTWTHTNSSAARGALVAINPAVTTVSSTATLASSSTLSVTGRQNVPASTGLTSTSTLVASGRQTIPSVVALASTSSLAAAPPFDPLQNIRTALAGQASARADIGIIAASITEGYPDTWDKTVEQRLAVKLRQRYTAAGSGPGGIPIPSAAVQGLGTSPVTWTGGTYDSAFGWGAGHGVWYTTPAQNGILKLTLPAAATQVLIDILKGTTGNAAGGRYRVNGGAWTTFDTLNGGGTISGTVTVNASLAAGDLVEVSYNAGAGNVVVTYLRVSNGDETTGIQVNNYGHAGFTLANWQAGTGGTPQWKAEIARHNLDLLILGEFGGNDGNSAGSSPLTAAAFQTAYSAFIDTIRAAGYTGDILCVGYSDVSAGITFVEPWANYLTAIQTVATAKGCGYVGYGAQGIPASPSGTLYAADNVHGNTNGVLYDLEADVLTQAITGQAVTAPTLASTSTLSAAGIQQGTATAVLSSASALTAVVSQQIRPAAVLGSTSTLAAAVTQQVTTAITMAGSSALVAAGQQTTPTAVALPSASALTIGAQQSVPAPAALVSSSTITAAGTDETPVTVLLASSSTLAVEAVRLIAAVATLVSSSTVTSAVTDVVTAPVLLASTSAVTVPGPLSVITAAVALASSSHLTVAGTGQLLAAVLLASDSTLSALGAVLAGVGPRTSTGPSWQTPDLQEHSYTTSPPTVHTAVPDLVAYTIG